MSTVTVYSVNPVGVVRSELARRQDAPKQGAEGAPSAWVEIDPAYADAIDGIGLGSEIVLVTWLHQSERSTLRVHPRGLAENEMRGVFATRSPDRPNPIGLHPVRVLEVVDGTRLRVEPLEAIDGTPVIDIKPGSC